MPRTSPVIRKLPRLVHHKLHRPRRLSHSHLPHRPQLLLRRVYPHLNQLLLPSSLACKCICLVIIAHSSVISPQTPDRCVPSWNRQKILLLRRLTMLPYRLLRSLGTLTFGLWRSTLSALPARVADPSRRRKVPEGQTR